MSLIDPNLIASVDDRPCEPIERVDIVRTIEKLIRLKSYFMGRRVIEGEAGNHEAARHWRAEELETLDLIAMYEGKLRPGGDS